MKTFTRTFPDLRYCNTCFNMATVSRLSSRQSDDRCAPPAKQKEIVLSIEKKLEIIDSLQKGASQSVIAEKYGIGRSTTADIKKQERKLRSFKQRMTELGIKNVKVKAMKIGSHKQLDEVLYIWFRQQWKKSIPVTGVLLQEKANYSINDFTQMLQHHFSPAWNFEDDL